MDRLLNSMTLLSVLIFVVVLVSVRRSHIRPEYSVSWLLVAAALLVMSRSRWWLDVMAQYLGISYPPMALVVLAGGGFLLMLFRLSVIISRLRDHNIALAQRLAIVEFHVQSLAEPVAGPERP